jgi:hypothetical protein
MNTTFKRIYVGKGRKVANLPIITVTLDWESLQEHVFEFEGRKFLRFEVAPLREEDRYGRTHTAYVSAKVAEEAPKPKKPRRKRSTAKA